MSKILNIVWSVIKELDVETAMNTLDHTVTAVESISHVVTKF